MEKEEKNKINRKDMVGGVSHGCAGCEHLMKHHFVCIELAKQEDKRRKQITDEEKL